MPVEPCCDAATLAQLRLDLTDTLNDIVELDEMYQENLTANLIIMIALQALWALRQQLLSAIAYCESNPCGAMRMTAEGSGDTYQPSGQIEFYRKAVEQARLQLQALEMRRATK